MLFALVIVIKFILQVILIIVKTIHMKRFKSTFTFLAIFLPVLCWGQTDSVMFKWHSLLNKPGLATYFSGMFNQLGIKVKGTESAFTVKHLGNSFSLEKGIKVSEVDYIIELENSNIENMSKHGEDGKIDSIESYKIMSVLFTPLTQASLDMPIFRNNKMRKLADVEDLIHVILLGPGKEGCTNHTLVFINKQWLVIPGLFGKAKRVFTLNTEQAILYQQKIFTAKKKNTMGGWTEFRKWYVEWRKSVSVTND